jgi:hypothetical protein
MKLNEGSGTDGCLIKSHPAVVEALCCHYK